MKDERKFKIAETARDYRVYVHAPNIKVKKNWFGWPTGCYYDTADMIWAPVDHWGNPEYRSDRYPTFPLTFDTYTEAMDFINRVRRPKQEVIV